MNQIKITLSLILLTAVLSSATLFYIHYKNIVNDLDTAVNNNAILSAAVEANEQTIKSMLSDIALGNELRKTVENERAAAIARSQELERKLEKHDLALLARNKPVLVERILNSATRDANRCLEILSGSALTYAEINAKKISEQNSSCPDIANPNRLDQ